MQLFVFARTTLRKYISRVETSAENTGVLHVFPNKVRLCMALQSDIVVANVTMMSQGGVLATLSVDGTSLAFVSSHLTAHEGVKKCFLRNASVEEIFSGIRSGNKKLDVPSQFHHTFFMGTRCESSHRNVI